MEGSARIAASRNDECELLDTIPQHDASAARCYQLEAEFLKVSAVVVCDAVMRTRWSAQIFEMIAGIRSLAEQIASDIPIHEKHLLRLADERDAIK
jgi:hypothetical protein